jgi:hypothetical protein
MYHLFISQFVKFLHAVLEEIESEQDLKLKVRKKRTFNGIICFSIFIVYPKIHCFAFDMNA